MGLDIFGLDILGLDILGLDILGTPQQLQYLLTIIIIYIVNEWAWLIGNHSNHKHTGFTQTQVMDSWLQHHL